MPPSFFRSLLLLLVSTIAILRPASAQAPLALDTGLAGRIEQEFRFKTRLPQGFHVTVLGIKESQVPAFYQGDIEYGDPGRSARTTFYLSRDRRYAFFSEAVDLMVDRKRDNLQHISLKNVPERGPRDAPITIVEFSDFQCPACGRIYSILELIMQRYPGKVQFVYKNYPLISIHNWAEKAAIAAECARAQAEGAFWPFYHAFFQNQEAITKDNIDSIALAIAADNGLKHDAFVECLAHRSTLPQIKQTIEEGRELGVDGTPSFFINGERLQSTSFRDFKLAIDPLLHDLETHPSPSTMSNILSEKVQ